MKKAAVVLSGCGVFDGAEIHEAVLTMLAIRLAGAEYVCFAPDIQQMHVVNHLSGEVVDSETRNVLVESARIARGDIKPLSELSPADFDVLLIPGGFGAAKNLSDFAINGATAKIHPQLSAVCQQFSAADKAIGYACIAPAMVAKIHGPGIKVTIGTDHATADTLNLMGAEHVNCNVDDIVIDKDHKIVTTPAYMLATRIDQAWEGIQKWVMQVLAFAERAHIE